MFPADDHMIEKCRNVLKCFNVNFRLLKAVYVHLLVCYLNKWFISNCITIPPLFSDNPRHSWGIHHMVGWAFLSHVLASARPVLPALCHSYFFSWLSSNFRLPRFRFIAGSRWQQFADKFACHNGSVHSLVKEIMRHGNLVSNRLWCLRISSDKKIKSARFEILTRLLLMILVFWDVTLSDRIIDSRGFHGTSCLLLNGSGGTWRWTALCTFETEGNFDRGIEDNKPEDEHSQD